MFGFQSMTMNMCVQTFDGDTLKKQILVCDGCCCGRVERGHNEVPIEMLKNAWKEHELDEHIKLTISTCLGPCSMHNVSLVKTGSERTWLGKLKGEDDYQALVGWACELAQNGDNTELPDRLVSHRFVPKV